MVVSTHLEPPDLRGLFLVLIEGCTREGQKKSLRSKC